MTNDVYDCDVVVTRRPESQREVLFRCIACCDEVEKPRWHYMPPHPREPLCNACTRRWGSKTSGPVFNRKNFHTLQQLSAVINMLTWEIKNGKRRYR